MNIFKKIFGTKAEATVIDDVGDTRTAIKSQGEPDLELAPAEEKIADTYERLPRQCRRAVDRQWPKGWIELDTYMNIHTVKGHRPGGSQCV